MGEVESLSYEEAAERLGVSFSSVSVYCSPSQGKLVRAGSGRVTLASVEAFEARRADDATRKEKVVPRELQPGQELPGLAKSAAPGVAACRCGSVATWWYHLREERGATEDEVRDESVTCLEPYCASHGPNTPYVVGVPAGELDDEVVVEEDLSTLKPVMGGPPAGQMSPAAEASLPSPDDDRCHVCGEEGGEHAPGCSRSSQPLIGPFREEDAEPVVGEAGEALTEKEAYDRVLAEDRVDVGGVAVDTMREVLEGITGVKVDHERGPETATEATMLAHGLEALGRPCDHLHIEPWVDCAGADGQESRCVTCGAGLWRACEDALQSVLRMRSDTRTGRSMAVQAAREREQREAPAAVRIPERDVAVDCAVAWHYGRLEGMLETCVSVDGVPGSVSETVLEALRDLGVHLRAAGVLLGGPEL